MIDLDQMTPNERRRQAQMGRRRSIRERVLIHLGMFGLTPDSPEWEETYQAHYRQLEMEQRIVEALRQSDEPLSVPELGNGREQFAKLVKDASTVVLKINRERLASLIEQRRVSPETLERLDTWLGSSQST